MKSYEELTALALQKARAMRQEDGRAVAVLPDPETRSERLRRRVLAAALAAVMALGVGGAGLWVMNPGRRAPEIGEEVSGALGDAPVSEPVIADLDSLPAGEPAVQPDESDAATPAATESRTPAPAESQAPAVVPTAQDGAVDFRLGVQFDDLIPVDNADLPDPAPALITGVAELKQAVETQVRAKIASHSGYTAAQQAAYEANVQKIIGYMLGKLAKYDDAYFSDRALVAQVVYSSYYGTTIQAKAISRKKSAMTVTADLQLPADSWASGDRLASHYSFFEIARRDAEGIKTVQMINAEKRIGTSSQTAVKTKWVDPERQFRYFMINFKENAVIPDRESLSRKETQSIVDPSIVESVNWGRVNHHDDKDNASFDYLEINLIDLYTPEECAAIRAQVERFVAGRQDVDKVYFNGGLHTTSLDLQELRVTFRDGLNVDIDTVLNPAFYPEIDPAAIEGITWNCRYDGSKKEYQRGFQLIIRLAPEAVTSERFADPDPEPYRKALLNRNDIENVTVYSAPGLTIYY